MTDGLMVSSIGIASAFAVLIVVMLLTRLITRVYPPMQEAGPGAEAATRGLVAPGAEEVAPPVAPAEVEEHLVPESTDEVVAIALALAKRMRDQGRGLEGRKLVIGEASYDVDVGDLSHSPVSVTVNGEEFWASLDGKGLPVARQNAPARGARTEAVQRGRGSAPPDG